MYYKGEKIKSSDAPFTDFHGYGPKIRSAILDRFPEKRRGLKVLDVGTGFGSTVSFLSKELPRSCKIWTLDPSQDILDSVKDTKFSDDVHNVEFVKGNAEKLGFESDSFDVIVSVMVLHHLEDLGAVCSELSRVLKKKGKLLLADYRPDAPSHLEFETRHLKSDFFKPEQITKKLRENGDFSKISTKTFDVWYLVEAIKK